jgi:PleD family two-component response regulator
MTYKVLVVNGNYAETTSLVDALSGYDTIIVHTAESWREAAVKLENYTYDCAILDYYLPEVNGIALLRMLFNEKTGMTALPVIMTAREEDETSLAYALRCGAQNYLVTDNISSRKLAAMVFNSINAFKIVGLAKEVETQVRATRETHVITQMTDTLIEDFEKFKKAISQNVTANDAGDADVPINCYAPRGIYWVY